MPREKDGAGSGRVGRAARRVLLTLLVLALPAPAAWAEWADWTLDADLSSSFETNVNRASLGSEEEWDLSFLPAVRVGRVYQLAERTRLSGSAEIGGEISSRFDELNAVDGGAHLALIHKFGIGDAPWGRILAEGGYRDVQDGKRSGPHFAVGAVTGKRFSPRLDARLAYRFVARYGGNGPPVPDAPLLPDDVFDQQSHHVTLDGRFLLTEQLLLGLGFGYRYGDFDSNARSNRFEVLATDDVDAVAMDRVFGGWVYKVRGNAYSPFVRLNYGLGRRWSVELGYRFQYGEGGGLSYENHAATFVALFRY